MWAGNLRNRQEIAIGEENRIKKINEAMGFENIEDSYFNNLINELNTMYSTPME